MTDLHAVAVLPEGWEPRDDRPEPSICVPCATCAPGGSAAPKRRTWTPIDDSPLAAVTCHAAALEWKPERPLPGGASPGGPVPGGPAPNRQPGRLDLDDKAPPCHVFPLSNTAANHQFLFLREIGGPTCLIPFLENIILFGEKSKFWGGTLIIDREVVLGQQLVVPDGFTLAGVGINGGGRLRFTSTGNSASAIKFDEQGARGGTIRDLAIDGPGGVNALNGVQLGLSKRDDNHPQPPGGYLLRHIRVAGFGGYGMQGGFHAFGVNIDGCQIIGNGDGIRLIRGCDAWRIRDCMIESSLDRGIELGHTEQGHVGAVKGTMISGCMFRRNRNGAIRIHAWQNQGDAIRGTLVFGNRFEANSGVAVEVVSPDSATRILSNFFASNEKLVLPPQDSMLATAWSTHRGFNACRLPKPDEPLSMDNDVARSLNNVKAPTP